MADPAARRVEHGVGHRRVHADGADLAESLGADRVRVLDFIDEERPDVAWACSAEATSMVRSADGVAEMVTWPVVSS